MRVCRLLALRWQLHHANYLLYTIIIADQVANAHFTSGWRTCGPEDVIFARASEPVRCSTRNVYAYVGMYVQGCCSLASLQLQPAFVNIAKQRDGSWEERATCSLILSGVVCRWRFSAARSLQQPRCWCSGRMTLLHGPCTGRCTASPASPIIRTKPYKCLQQAAELQPTMWSAKSMCLALSASAQVKLKHPQGDDCMT